MPYWVGLDMGIERVSICVIDHRGKVVTQAIEPMDHDAIAEILIPIQRSVRGIGVEAGVGIHLVRSLKAAAFPVRVIDTARSAKFLGIYRSKSDVSDARGLAELVRVGRSIGTEVHVKSLEAQNIRSMLVIRRQVITQRVKVEQLVQAVVRLNGGEMRLSNAPGRFETGVVVATPLIAAGAMSVEADLAPLVELAGMLRRQQDIFDRRIAAIADANPACRLMMSVPGIGSLTALSFYAAIEDPGRFACSRNVGAYLGLVPVFYQSGNSLRRGRISRAGCKVTRTLLVNAATCIMYRTRAETALKTWALGLRTRLGPGKARVALARKLAVLLLRLWKTGQSFDPRHGLPEPA